MLTAELNEVTSKISDSGISVHKLLGAGLLEKVYQECLHYELSLRGFFKTGTTLLALSLILILVVSYKSILL